MRGMLQWSGLSLVKCSQQVLTICFGPRVTLANRSLAVALADNGKADGKRELSKAVVIERSDPTETLTPAPTGTVFVQCHLTPEP